MTNFVSETENVGNKNVLKKMTSEKTANNSTQTEFSFKTANQHPCYWCMFSSDLQRKSKFIHASFHKNMYTS